MSDKKGCREGGCGICRPAAAPAPPVSAASLSEDFYKRLIDHLYDAVYFVDVHRRITYWNHAAELLTGYSASDVIGRVCAEDLLMHTDGKGTDLCRTCCPLSETIVDGRARDAEVYLRHKNGHRVPVSIRVGPIRDPHGDIVGAVEIFSDNAAKKEAEQKASQLEQMAFLDYLTRVPNRRFLDLRLRQILEESRRYGHVFGVMLVDLDDFKQINDRYGHSVGDAALVVTAQTLARSLRAVDNLGRWGGDEFLAILPEVKLHDLQALAERCRVLIDQSRVAGPKLEIRIHISIGATVVEAGDTPESAVHRADEKLYESKKQGKSRATVG